MSDWQSSIDDTIAKRERAIAEAVAEKSKAQTEMEAFFTTVIHPAFDEFAQALESRGRKVLMHKSERRASMLVTHGETTEFEAEFNRDKDHNLIEVKQVHMDSKDGKKFRTVDSIRPGTMTKDGFLSDLSMRYAKGY